MTALCFEAKGTAPLKTGAYFFRISGGFNARSTRYIEKCILTSFVGITIICGGNNRYFRIQGKAGDAAQQGPVTFYCRKVDMVSDDSWDRFVDDSW